MGELRRTELSVRQEQALLVGAIMLKKKSAAPLELGQQPAALTGNRAARDGEDPLIELESLARTAGAHVVGTMRQKIRRIDPAYYIGRGKAEQVRDKAKLLSANVIIFDNDLSPAQIRDLEETINLKVVDRSELILDIFATRARTYEAQLAVELAQLEYAFPRLRAMWTHLDTVAGGASTAAGAVGAIGTRGPGEKQLETDRRLVRKRIDKLRGKLGVIEERRRREVAARRDIFTVSLVGYTNAGKSSLLNALTGAGVFVEDKLFATLDTKTVQWKLAPSRIALISDTVGFVRDLPHHLIASFKATLEETTHADLLLHVVDAANPQALAQVLTVEKVLGELGIESRPSEPQADACGHDGEGNARSGRPAGAGSRLDQQVQLVFNKIDAIEDLSVLHVLKERYPQAICVSAKTGRGLAELNERVLERMQGRQRRVTIRCSAGAGRLLDFLESHADQIHRRGYEGDQACLEMTIGAKWLDALAQFDGEVKVEPAE